MVGEQAVNLRRDLSRQHPLTPKKFEKLADSLEALSSSWRGSAAPELALEAIDEALNLRRTIALKSSLANLNWALSITLCNRSYILGDLGRYSEACDAAQEGLAIQQALFPSDPADVAHTLFDLAILRKAAGQVDAAIEAAERAAKLRRELLEKGDLTIKPGLSNSLHNLASYFSSAGQHARARDAYKESIKLRRELTGVDAMNKQLGDTLTNFALELRALGQHQEALVANQEAVDIQRERAASNPTDLTIKNVLAQSLYDTAMDFRDLGKDSDALWTVEEAISLQRKLYETDPTIKGDLARSLLLSAIVLSILKRHQDAVNADQEAIKLRKELVDTDQE
ncbi:hypothetical protein DFH09DRAFT_953572, partial [Mycena vulgaris]